MNNAVLGVRNLVSQLLQAQQQGKSIIEALRVYEAEVVERGSQGVLDSLEDAVTLTKLDELGKSRIYQQGLRQ